MPSRGAGKTTTATDAALMAGGKTHFVAFNKHIADALKDKLKGRATASTLHSLGYAAVCKHKDVYVDPDKARKLLATIWPGAFKKNKQYLTDAGKAVIDLARAAKLHYLMEWEPHAYLELADHKGIDIPAPMQQVFEATTALLQACIDREDTVDYDDMVWLPIMNNWKLDTYDLLVVDEVQDLSKLTQELACRLMNGGRMLAIGDPRQAIMGFAGADCDSMDTLTNRLATSPRGWQTLPLSVTFRCPWSHVALAQQVVPHITAAPNAPEGVTDTLTVGEMADKAKPADLIISRRNKMLTGMAYKLVLRGLPCMIRGRDFGVGLKDLVWRLRAENVAHLIVRLSEYEEKELLRLERRDAGAAAYQSLEDKVETLMEIAKQSQSIEQVTQFLDSVFSDERGANKVVLSSVHRAKGLEADTVFVLDTDNLPLVRKDQKEWEYKQELNLLYVALTRAKNALYFEEKLPAYLRPGYQEEYERKQERWSKTPAPCR